ncbi:hypothetical protein Ddye_021561 [Dipteronia dyeriana]|uniref:Alpha-carbonic anhydrase domain-containing protein n=1 Tax=Dipteronia dyeriana TaxID=168575 RepID=A0AAD9WX02_9ROSI|nr:hypothetical protein Ddye_021561 [Dipteronia dyeriana]
MLLEIGSVEFSYSGSPGPSNSVCSTGKKQSPVNIKKNETVLGNNLKPLYKQYTAAAANATLINLCRDIELQYGVDIGGIKINGKKFVFKQMHWHTPSEHLFDGQRYAAELHLVHEAEDHSAAVIANLYQYGKSPQDIDPFLAKLGDGLQKLSKDNCEKNEGSRVSIGMLDTKPLTQNTAENYQQGAGSGIEGSIGSRIQRECKARAAAEWSKD